MRASIKKQLVLWSVWGFVVVGVPACASILGLKDGEVPADASVSQDGASDALFERPDIDGGHIDEDASVAVCGDAGGGDIGYWVAPTGSGGQCSKAAPCSLDFALSTVQTGQTIHLANGVYQGQDIVKTPPAVTDVRVEGGWSWGGGLSWTPVCDEKLAEISSGVRFAAVYAQRLSNWTFALLTIRNTRTPDAGGPTDLSNIGLMAIDSQLKLENVRIFTANGLDGVDGGPGGDAPPLVGPCSPGSGAAGSAGGPGTAAVLACDGDGCHDLAPGSAGADGTDGQNGALGGQGQCNSGCKACQFVNPQTCDVVDASDVCSGPGAPGCGGAKGFGGGPGTSGGSSIALYAWSSTITFTGGAALKSGYGGNGGIGGDPGAGLDGSAGTAGPAGTGSCLTGLTCSPAGSFSCFTSGVATAPPVQGGSPGTAGGHGGPGGKGGGGNGGHSYCYFSGNGSSIINPPDGGTEFHTGGAGGPAGGVNGDNKVGGP